MKSLPTYETILRLKRMYHKKQLPISQLQDVLRAAYKKRGSMWFSTNLSWYK